VNLSRLNALFQKKNNIFKEMYFKAHIGGMHSAYPVQ
jgi:hypothetical protein